VFELDILDCPILVCGPIVKLSLHRSRASGARNVDGTIAAIRIQYDDIVAPLDRRQALWQVGFFVERQD
jgi:hypothetical protein